jgi:steroid 5-alpha reductase family enzyme
VIIAWTAFALNNPAHLRPLLTALLTSVWGIRLSSYLLARNWEHGEDKRYVVMREHHGKRFWWVSLFTVFLLQGVILWIVSLPLQLVAAVDSPVKIFYLDGIGILVWTIGFLFESIGDWQLAQFKKDPANKGRVMDRGLWRYTRHPNYFGDICIWWGFYLIAAGGGAGWSVISPLLMTYLLMRVSGVTLLESTIADRRPEYAAYQARTNALFPGLPKKTSRRVNGGRS